MNHYGEAIAVGIVATTVLFFAGVGADKPVRAATATAVSTPDAAASVVTPYDTAFYRARAELAKAQWRYEFALREHTRAVRRYNARTGSREDLDASVAAVKLADAVLQTDRAALTGAQANLAKSATIPLAQIKVARY
jgi:hypothetical protein